MIKNGKEQKMKRITATALAALIVTVSFAGTNVLQKAWLKGTTDKDPLSYKPGEEMVFTVASQNIRGDIPMGTYFLKWERTGDDGVSENGSEPLTGKPFVEIVGRHPFDGYDFGREGERFDEIS